MPDEFDLIATYFAPLAGDFALGLKDDAACFAAKPGYDLIVSKDVLVEGVHFFKNTPADHIAFKAVAVNVSDLAAKGAVPHAYLVGLTVPSATDDSWWPNFANGLRDAQSKFGLQLAGGDTTSFNADAPLVISVTVMGYVPEGMMIKRSGASVGDDIYVTGTLGDSALGLAGLQNKIVASDFLVRRYHFPEPRPWVGTALIGLATAAADISDGLVADLGHICRASGTGATIKEDLLPLSGDAQIALEKDGALKALVYGGGDDYEILFTASIDRQAEVTQISAEVCVPITKIGTIEKQPAVRLVDMSGDIVHTQIAGFQHFR
ncbi:MAG: thiamine-phosphate kinase [Kordiimonadaceae bacterium]|nr:thiamine-phosphate kinase [Kordiimonadaceae bacterium]